MKERRNERILQSRDVKLEPIGAEPELPPLTGPRTATMAEWQKDDAAFLRMKATPEELKIFRASIQARLDRVEATGWKTLPNGISIKADAILTTCSHCKRWDWTPIGNCFICNWQNRKGGGMMRAATKKEEAAWFKKAAEREAKFKADAPKRAKDLADFNKRRFQDAGKDER